MDAPPNIADLMEMDFEYRREDENFRARRLMRRAAPPHLFLRSRYALVLMVLAIVLSLGVVNGILSLIEFVLLIVVATYGTRLIWTGVRMNGDNTSPLFGRKHLRMDGEGVLVESDRLKLWVGWNSIRDVEETPLYILLYYDLVRAIVLPKASFSSPERLEECLAAIRKHVSISRIGAQAAPENDPVHRVSGMRMSGSAWLWLLLIAVVLLPNLMMLHGSLDEKPPVDITVGESKTVDHSVVVLGQARNRSSSDWDVMSLEMRFYNADGKMIDQCETYASIHVQAKASASFKASCGVPRDGNASQQGTLLPETPGTFTRVEITAIRGYKPGLLPLLR